jgi:uncharacterized protein (TIGR03083 family)
MDLWATIAAERQALADDLASLNDKQWATPSLCGGWSVRDVLAHMTATAETTPLTFLPRMVGAGFKLSKMSEKDIAARTKGAPAETLSRFRSRVSSRKHPPGPADTWLGETIVHAEDIRRPLGIAHTYPDEALARVTTFYSKSNLVIGGKDRVAGLKLTATDADFSIGSGAEVSGPLLALAIVTAGRKEALGELSGAGVKTLTSRM